MSIQFTELASVPSIGQLLHFHPDKHTRLAAFVVEVHPIERDETSILLRPKVDLQICKLDGTFSFRKGVEPYDDEEIKGRWSFPNEMPLVIEDEDVDDDEQRVGSKSNAHIS